MVSPKRPDVAELQHQVDTWNGKHCVGIRVRVQLDNGDFRMTTTREPGASVLGGHSAVVWLEGMGCYRLDRVTPAPTDIEAYRELFTLTNVTFIEPEDPNDYGNRIEGAASALLVPSSGKIGCVNDGYGGFVAFLRFDAAGKLLNFAILE